jgi:hypothetical protein
MNTEKIDYPRCSSDILTIDLADKGFSISYIYRIFGNSTFNMGFASNKVTKNLPYIELLIPTNKPGTYNVYNNTSIKNEFETTDGTNLLIEDPFVIVNDKRRWMMDQLYQLEAEPDFNTPLYINAKFNNYPQLGMTLKWTASTILNDSSPYEITQVNRSTCYVYNPDTIVYLLVDLNSSYLQIYVLQSLNLQTFENESVNNIDYIGNKLDLPKNWLWTSIKLDSNTFLKVASNGTAFIVQDNLGNSYQYLDSKYAPWLYEQYSYLNTIN